MKILPILILGQSEEVEKIREGLRCAERSSDATGGSGGQAPSMDSNWI